MDPAKPFSILAISRTKVFFLAAAALLLAPLPCGAAEESPDESSHDLVIRNVRIFDGTRVIPQGDGLDRKRLYQSRRP